MPDILNRVGTALSKSSVISDEYSTQVSCCSINHTHTHTITLSHTHRVNQDEMLASVRDKRLQFEDTTKMTEITTLLQRLPQCRQNVSVLAKQMQTLGKRVKRLQVCE
jgi:hypothetical protein